MSRLVVFAGRIGHFLDFAKLRLMSCHFRASYWQRYVGDIMTCGCLWQRGSYRTLCPVISGKAIDIVMLGTHCVWLFVAAWLISNFMSCHFRESHWHRYVGDTLRVAVCGSVADIELYVLLFQGKLLTSYVGATMTCSCLWQHGSYRTLYPVISGKATDSVMLGHNDMRLFVVAWLM